MRSRHVHLKLKCLVPGTPWKTQYWKLSLWGTKSLHTNYQENELFFSQLCCAASHVTAGLSGAQPGEPGAAVPQAGQHPPAGRHSRAASPAPGRRGGLSGRDEHLAAGTSTWRQGRAPRTTVGLAELSCHQLLPPRSSETTNGQIAHICQLLFKHPQLRGTCPGPVNSIYICKWPVGCIIAPLYSFSVGAFECWACSEAWH